MFTFALTIGSLLASAVQAASARMGNDATEASDVKILLSVATRNRFWPHALSLISIVESVRHLQSTSVVSPRLRVEWHVIDDASDENVRRKNKMIHHLVDQGLVQNYTKLAKPSGTVRVLGHFVDVMLSRSDLRYWLHCDDDVLFAPDLISTVVRDYHRDLAGAKWRGPHAGVSSPSKSAGGLLAIFVNSWLDEQLSSSPPAFGPYKVAPFLGGASYILDRDTLVATGNPWTGALRINSSVSPHEAHVYWMRQLLPASGLPIWIRWDRPYQCQHLGNVKTLNFGRQPDWEPMWAIDHTTKKIVEVVGYSSQDLRAALWAGGDMLRDYVLSVNSRFGEPLRLPGSWDTAKSWSPWHYTKSHANYIEIGTGDFDALLQRHVFRPDIVGISIEPVKAYFDRLPQDGGHNKTLLNVAIGEYDGFADMFLVRPELIEGYMGSESLCQVALARAVGLPGGRCLPGWVRGTSSLKAWPQGVRQLLEESVEEGVRQRSVSEVLRSILVASRVAVLTYATLLTVYGIGSVDIVKIDAEGTDHILLRQVIDYAEQSGVWPWQVQFEKNSLSDWRALDAQVERLQTEFRYSCRMTGAESVACWRPGRAL